MAEEVNDGGAAPAAAVATEIGASAAAAAAGGPFDGIGGAAAGGNAAAGGSGAGDGAAAADAGAAAPAGDDAAAADPKGADAGGSEWLDGLIEGASDDDKANLEWLKAKGYKSVSGLAKSYREAERQIRNGGVEVPGENATDEQRAAYREKMGIPDKPEGYEFAIPQNLELPEGAGLNDDLVAFYGDAAHKLNLPKDQARALFDAVVEKQVSDHMAEVQRNDTAAAEFLKSQPDGGVAAKAHANRAWRNLGIEQKFGTEFLGKLQAGLGAADTFKFMSMLGEMTAEDTFGADGKTKQLGMNAAEAQVQLTAFENDKGKAEKLRLRDPATIAEHDRLTRAVAAGMPAV
ncbi:hypothetical protein ACSMXM_01310 [Pacificimonas sp. ICDLI1SI03]